MPGIKNVAFDDVKMQETIAERIELGAVFGVGASSNGFVLSLYDNGHPHYFFEAPPLSEKLLAARCSTGKRTFKDTVLSGFLRAGVQPSYFLPEGRYAFLDSPNRMQAMLQMHLNRKNASVMTPRIEYSPDRRTRLKPGDGKCGGIPAIMADDMAFMEKFLDGFDPDRMLRHAGVTALNSLLWSFGPYRTRLEEAFHPYRFYWTVQAIVDHLWKHPELFDRQIFSPLVRPDELGRTYSIQKKVTGFHGLVDLSILHLELQQDTLNILENDIRRKALAEQGVATVDKCESIAASLRARRFSDAARLTSALESMEHGAFVDQWYEEVDSRDVLSLETFLKGAGINRTVEDFVQAGRCKRSLCSSGSGGTGDVYPML